MMSQDALKSLALETIQSPRSAAQKIMSLHLSRDVLWTGLALVAVINAIIYSFSLFLSDTSVLPPIFSNPILFFVIITGLLVLSVHAFYWTGRAMGGQGDLGDLLALLVWLQGLRAVAQLVMFVLILLSPLLAQLFSLAIGVLGLWITVNFITEALRLPSLMYGVGVLILAAVGLMIGLMIFIGLIGLGAMGVPANV
ncbi:YIP1 family protein [Sulfitobacter sp. F26169L]|uniref:YIP1 family protein n=1 Tax=Sulfitobacter sp. F26169L TaxID=2996015 RepID=UPI002260F750|nr:YIP1 family protein [Sulfitobacter sp. F26169L]MCX7565448.1 YIP1 family protein [Sulfitobacter sp. F26169L]